MHPLPRGFLIGAAVASIQLGCEALTPTLEVWATLTPTPTPTPTLTLPYTTPPPVTVLPNGDTQIGGCFTQMAGKTCLKWQI